jgi:hypothetical protein
MREGLKLAGLNWLAQLNWPALRPGALLQKVSPDELLTGGTGAKKVRRTKKYFNYAFSPMKL